MELFYAAGSGLIHDLREKGFEVFLDLKLHDIPNTVAGGVRSVTSTAASLLTLHASGGERMMVAAVEAAQAPGSPRLLAVTVLTSMDGAELVGTGVAASPRDQAVRLALLAQRCGVAGMVCSPEEVEALRGELDIGKLLVVPGIRPSGAPIGDQRRIATPGSAIRDGASMLVVGRPITRAVDPAQAASAILAEIEAASFVASIKRRRDSHQPWEGLVDGSYVPDRSVGLVGDLCLQLDIAEPERERFRRAAALEKLAEIDLYNVESKPAQPA